MNYKDITDYIRFDKVDRVYGSDDQFEKTLKRLDSLSNIEDENVETFLKRFSSLSEGSKDSNVKEHKIKEHKIKDSKKTKEVKGYKGGDSEEEDKDKDKDDKVMNYEPDYDYYYLDEPDNQQFEVIEPVPETLEPLELVEPIEPVEMEMVEPAFGGGSYRMDDFSKIDDLVQKFKQHNLKNKKNRT